MKPTRHKLERRELILHPSYDENESHTRRFSLMMSEKMCEKNITGCESHRLKITYGFLKKDNRIVMNII